MILVDYSQIAIANIMQSARQGVNEDMVPAYDPEYVTYVS